MLAAYSTRRSSVVLNPRGRVLGGLGEEGGGGDAPSGGDGGYGYDSGDSGEGYTGFALARAEAEMAAIAAAQDAEEAANAAREASYSGSPTAAQALAEAQAAAEDAAYAAQEAARFANAAASSKAASAAAAEATKTAASNISTVVSAALSLLGLPGKIAAMAVSGFIGKALAGLYENNKNFTSAYADAQSALDGAKGYAGDNKQLLTQINTLQKSLESVKNAGVEAAIKQLYATYAHRAVDPGAMKYWSDRFGPTVTPDEVLQFQEFLYANEPNLRPAVVTKIEPAAGAGTGLALPLIAAIAGYFILGS